MYELNVLDVNDQLIECVFDGTPFSVNLSWNQAANAFFFSLLDSEEELLLAGQKVVPNVPLFRQHRAAYMPLGELAVILRDTAESLDRKSFARGDATLVYLTEPYLAEIGWLKELGKV